MIGITLAAVIITVASITVALMPTGVLAQQREVYDARTGKVIGRATTDTAGSTTIYGSDGRVSDRASTSGNVTTIYDASGRRTGSVTSTKQPSTSK